MIELPINSVLPEIKKTLASANRAVLQAPPGAGKTTAVPIALLDQYWLTGKQIIMLEPRRIAARNAAARMAFLLGEKVGQTVGYQVRQDKQYSDSTKILVVTEGILTRRLQADPELGKTALVIFDEFHERSIHADLSLALCLQSQQILREDLKILVMSATLNTNAISELLDNAAIIQSEGRSHPVEIQYLDRPIPVSSQRELLTALSKTVNHVISHFSDSCLVFLPGVREISRLHDQIKQHVKTAGINNILLAPLHGNLNKQQQDQAISPAPAGKRKIVLATNIAETSLTIEGINCVIDSGLERVLQYDPSSGMDRLVTQFISQDSATQRSGRAGRLSAGSCYRLWTEQQQKRLLKHSIAEIQHSDLSPLILEICHWGASSPDELQWLDMPPAGSSSEAYDLLYKLQAIDAQNRITPHGKNLLSLGCHPRLAHMMLAAAEFGQAYHACLIASLLTEKDIYATNAEKTYDMHDRIKILTAITSKTSSRATHSDNHNNIETQQCKRIIETADEFYRRLKPHCHITLAEAIAGKTGDNTHHSINNELTGVLLAHAYPDRIAKQRNPAQPRYLLSNGKGANIPVFLQKQLYDYIVVANLDSKTSVQAKNGEASIYLAAEISIAQIEKFFSHIIERQEITEWNSNEQRVDTRQTSSIGKIILQQTSITPEDKTTVHRCLLQAIQDTGLKCFEWGDRALGLQHRVQFINKNGESYPAIEKLLRDNPLPDLSETHLLNTLTEWLLPFLINENSFKNLQKIDLYKLLSNQLSWSQQQLIEQLAPEKITVPSGSSIHIDYSDIDTPVLAVRLQEVFGLYETPAVLNGNINLMMHLLSPARRPMQVTQDLKSFWQSTYHEVKKELRGKYKRHYWPDDPFTAQATSKTKKQMNRDIEEREKNQ